MAKKTKLVRVTLGVLTRVEHTEVLEVPADMTDEELEALVDQRFDEVDPDAYSQDHAFWEKGQSCGFDTEDLEGEQPSQRVRRKKGEFVVTAIEG